MNKQPTWLQVLLTILPIAGGILGWTFNLNTKTERTILRQDLYEQRFNKLEAHEEEKDKEMIQVLKEIRDNQTKLQILIERKQDRK